MNFQNIRSSEIRNRCDILRTPVSVPLNVLLIFGFTKVILRHIVTSKSIFLIQKAENGRDILMRFSYFYITHAVIILVLTADFSHALSKLYRNH
jgi:hypothetical protein